MCLSISAQVNHGFFASAVPHPSVGKAIFFVLSEGADEFGVFGSKASSRPRSRLCAWCKQNLRRVDKSMFDLRLQVIIYPERE